MPVDSLRLGLWKKPGQPVLEAGDVHISPDLINTAAYRVRQSFLVFPVSKQVKSKSPVKDEGLIVTRLTNDMTLEQGIAPFVQFRADKRFSVILR